MAQAPEEELNALDIECSHTNTNLNADQSLIATSPLTEEELKDQVQELNELMDPSQLTRTQQHCIAQTVACFIAIHIHRYYHSAKFVTSMNNKLQNLYIADPVMEDAESSSDQNESLHLIYPVPMMQPPPKSLFPPKSEDHNNNDDNNNNTMNSDNLTDHNIETLSQHRHSNSSENNNNSIMSLEQKTDDIELAPTTLLKQPIYYRESTSTNYEWGRMFLQKFCKYLEVPQIQIEGYMHYLESPWIDPGPFFETLKWKIRKKDGVTNQPLDNNLLRIPLLLLQFAISEDGYYDSRLRSLLKTVTSYCQIRWNEEFAVREYSFGVVLHVLLQKKEAKSSTKNYGRWAKIGAVGLVGGALIAFTGGLAAPAVAAGLGAIGLTATGTFLLTTTGTATLYVLFGVTGAGYAGAKMHNTVCEVKDFKFISLSSNSGQSAHNGLNVIITVSGWLEGVDDDDDGDDHNNNDDEGTGNSEIRNNDQYPSAVGDRDPENDTNQESKQEDKDNGDNKKEKTMPSDDAISDELDVGCRDYWTRIMSDNGDVHLRSDCYTLQFEKKAMLFLGQGLKKFVGKKAVSGAVSSGAKVGLAYTTFATLVAALTWPVALLAVADYIDNPWTVAFAKSKEAGLVLADCLASGNHGRRPVTLIGYSLGARVIYYALKELVHRQNMKKHKKDESNEEKESVDNEQDAASETSRFKMFKRKKGKKETKKEKKEKMNLDLRGMIENVVILGGPLSCDEEEWTAIRSIVSDRIINCYSENDWVLKFVYRAAKATTSVAGLMPIRVDGVENVDLSECIDGHSEYHEKTPVIIKYLVDSCGLRL